MLPQRRAPVPKWNRQYVRGAAAPPAPAIRQMLQGADWGLRPDSLRGVIARMFEQPIELSAAIPAMSKLVGDDNEAAKRLLAEMVRATWIEESIAHPVFERPIFIIASPRSGSNLLFEQLGKARGLWHIGGESHGIFDRVLRHSFYNPEFDSIRATAGDASPERTHLLVDQFTRRLVQAETGVRFMEIPEERRPRAVRVLDKLPKNSFRVSFIDASFPDAKFIYLWREPRGNVSSLIEAWREGRESGRFVTYEQLPGTSFKKWCLVLPPGWRDVVDRGIEEIAAFQWSAANQAALDDLTSLPHDRWCSVSYADLIAQPETELRRLCEFAGLDFVADAAVRDARLAPSRTTLTPPSDDKWKKNAELIERIMPVVQPVAERVAEATLQHAALAAAAAAAARHP